MARGGTGINTRRETPFVYEHRGHFNVLSCTTSHCLYSLGLYSRCLLCSTRKKRMDYYHPVLDFCRNSVIEYNNFSKEIFQKGFVLDNEGIWFYDKNLHYDEKINKNRPFVSIFQMQKLITDVEQTFDQISSDEVAFFMPCDHRFHYILIPLLVTTWMSPQLGADEIHSDVSMTKMFGFDYLQTEREQNRKRNIRGYSFPMFHFEDTSLSSEDMLKLGVGLTREIVCQSSLNIIEDYRKQDSKDESYLINHIRVAMFNANPVDDATKVMAGYLNIDPDTVHGSYRVRDAFIKAQKDLMDRTPFQLYNWDEVFNLSLELFPFESTSIFTEEEIERYFIEPCEELYLLTTEILEEGEEEPIQHAMQFCLVNDDEETAQEKFYTTLRRVFQELSGYDEPKPTSITVLRLTGQMNLKVRYNVPCYSKTTNRIFYIESPYAIYPLYKDDTCLE